MKIPRARPRRRPRSPEAQAQREREIDQYYGPPRDDDDFGWAPELERKTPAVGPRDDRGGERT